MNPEKKGFTERLTQTGKELGVATGMAYLGLLVAGVWPLGTIAGVYMIHRAVENFSKTIGVKL